MGIMSGLLIPSQKFNISLGNKCLWRDLLNNDLYLLNQLRDARYVCSNDLLYAYCTEYSLTDILCHMNPVDRDFSFFKLKLTPYLRGFYESCVERRLSEMFTFYKGIIASIKDNQEVSFFGHKTFIDTLNFFAKETDRKKMDKSVDDVYLTLKNYLKYQFNETTEMIPTAMVEGFMLNLETILITCNENLSDDQFRRKACRVIEIVNLFINYSKSLESVQGWHMRQKYQFDNRALMSYDSFWKQICSLEGVTPLIQKVLPYTHIETDAAVCLFPCTTDYPLLTSDVAKQGRKANQNSQVLLFNWVTHSILISKLEIQKNEEDEWKRNHNLI